MAVAAGRSRHVALFEQPSMDAPCKLAAYQIMAFATGVADIHFVHSGGRIRGPFYGVAAMAVAAVRCISL